MCFNMYIIIKQVTYLKKLV